VRALVVANACDVAAGEDRLDATLRGAAAAERWEESEEGH